MCPLTKSVTYASHFLSYKILYKYMRALITENKEVILDKNVKITKAYNICLIPKKCRRGILYIKDSYDVLPQNSKIDC